MERNRVVTGLAQIVIVAESNTKGGTWDGAHGALEQKRPLYVCQMEAPALPGNSALLQRGAFPLPWPAADLTHTLSPLLHTSQQIQQKQIRMVPPPDQLSLLAISNQ